MMSEDMVQGGHSDAIRMTSLNRLLQLSRISEKDDVVRSLRDGQYVRQGHLRGFVNEQRVDAKASVRSSPEVRRSSAHSTGCSKCIESLLVVLHELQADEILFLVLFVDLLNAPDRQTFLG